MKGLIQRVAHASVVIDGKVAGEIGRGILLFLGVERGDSEIVSERLLEKVLAYRIFPDLADKMNLSLRDIHGGLLIVSQFTLAADTRKGLRPSFSSAADPRFGEDLYNHFVELARERYGTVQTGRFGANMDVHLINDGPVTFLLDIPVV